MLSQLSSLAVLLPLVAAQTYPQTGGRFIHDNSLGEYYPYAVSLPANNADTLAPTILSLAGKGSIFQEGVTWPIDSTVSYGCAGWRASRYMNGTREEADVLVGETFITITPYVHLFDANEAGEYNLTVDGVMAVINDARTKYPIDPNRIYLQGYSSGARAVWDVLPANEGYFAAATIAAGVPQPNNFTGLPNMLNIPLHIYTGTTDYDAYSQAYMAEAYQAQIQSLGGNKSELIYEQGVDHNDMQQTPYDADMFYWLLNQTNSAATPEQLSAAQAPNPSATQLYESILSYEFAYESLYSASLINDGLPSASRASISEPSSTLAPLSLAASAVSTDSASFSQPTVSLSPGNQAVSSGAGTTTASCLLFGLTLALIALTQ